MPARIKGVYFSTQLPPPAQLARILGSRYLMICDRKLQKISRIRNWLTNQEVYFVQAGEELKSLERFPRHFQQISRQMRNKSLSGFVSLGGGSVGDFTGFLASVYQRGRHPLIHIPSTVLAMLDSAHGGKTALNAGGVKNQIGSYCFPKAVFLVHSLLSSLPPSSLVSGELVKIALIDGGKLYTSLRKNPASPLWPLLPLAIRAKWNIVRQDPLDNKALRAKLNLGHTIGHIIESFFQMPHGTAVGYGLIFALRWSASVFGLSPGFIRQVQALLNPVITTPPLPFGKNPKSVNGMTSLLLQKIPGAFLKSHLLQDKKCAYFSSASGSSADIQFVFIRQAGQIEVIPTPLAYVLQEVHRQIQAPEIF